MGAKKNRRSAFPRGATCPSTGRETPRCRPQPQSRARRSKPSGRFRQAVRLRIVDHLHAMLDLAVMGVEIGQVAKFATSRGIQLARASAANALTVRRERSEGSRPPATSCLVWAKNFDLADAARAQLHVVTLKLKITVQALVAAYPSAALSMVSCTIAKSRCRRQTKGLSVSRNRAPAATSPATGPRLDVGRAFPGPPVGLVVAFRRRHRDAGPALTLASGRRRRSVRKTYPSAVVSPRLAAILRVARMKPARASNHLVGVEAVRRRRGRSGRCRRIVQLSRAHLAHGERGPCRRRRGGGPPPSCRAACRAAPRPRHGCVSAADRQAIGEIGPGLP